MSRSGSVKVVKAVKPANDDSFALSLKEIEAMEHQRIARLADDERKRIAIARRAAEDADAKLRLEKTKAAAAERAAEQEAQLVAIREREAARLCDAKANAIVEVERIAAAGRVRIEEIEKQRKYDLAIETMRMSAKGAATKRTIVSALCGALFAIAASVGVHAFVMAPAENARVTQMSSTVAERDDQIQKLRGDVDTQASHVKGLEKDVSDLKSKLDDANHKLAETPAPPPKTGPKPNPIRNEIKKDVDYGMPLCPPGVVNDPICLPNPIKK